MIDIGTTATLAFPTAGGGMSADGLTATLNAHFGLPPWLGLFPRWPNFSVRVIGTRGSAELHNYLTPWVHHYITVESSEKEGEPLRKRTEKRYGDLGWSTQVSLCLLILLF
jgi:hypothetical protein